MMHKVVKDVKEIAFETIVSEVETLCMKANYELGKDVIRKIEQAKNEETSEIATDILQLIIDNAHIASTEHIPMCQDTGVAVFFVRLGQDCRIVGGNLIDAINEGVRRGYKNHFLRYSIVSDPLDRENTGDNTPAIVHVDIVDGDKLEITLSAKGGGAENMSRLKMLKPHEGALGVKHFVLETVKKAGPNACPPLVVGVGIGGNFERCAILAKKALTRPLGEKHPDPRTAELELEWLDEINQLQIGPQGFGGKTTALAVHIEKAPCHIASLPVAVNLNCHATRHKAIIL